MKDEYDFSGGQRGRFYRPGAELTPPVYLDAGLHAALKERADAQGLTVEDLVTRLLRSSIGRSDAAE